MSAHAAAAAATAADARRPAGGDAGEAAAKERQAGSFLEQLARQLGLRPEHLRDLRLGPRLWAPSMGGRQQAPCGGGSSGGGGGVPHGRPPAGGGSDGAGVVSPREASQQDPQPRGAGEQAAAASRRRAPLDGPAHAPAWVTGQAWHCITTRSTAPVLPIDCSLALYASCGGRRAPRYKCLLRERVQEERVGRRPAVGGLVAACACRAEA